MISQTLIKDYSRSANLVNCEGISSISDEASKTPIIWNSEDFCLKAGLKLSLSII